MDIDSIYLPQSMDIVNIITIFTPMKKTKTTKVVQDIVKLGIRYKNAYRIANNSNSQACVALVSLITDLHSRGVIVVR